MSKKKVEFVTDVLQQKEKYEEYINDHIANVQGAYALALMAFKHVFPGVYKNKSHYNQLMYNLKHHDMSKNDQNEFWYYAARFFPINGTDPESKIVKDNFQIAWLHHVHNNPHHPAHWALVDDGKVIILNMPDIYIIEMICDWMAMSKYYNSTTKEYWKSESAQKLPISEYTKSKINEVLNNIYFNPTL